MFEKPIGMRDTLPELYELKRQVREGISHEMKKWGYQFMETPTLEYYDTVGSSSAILDKQLFKLLDNQGNNLVLRPDMTAPIARVAASKLLEEDLPLRLAYSGNVFRAQQREGGRPAEFEQIGVECIADKTVHADGEIISLLVSTLKVAGLKKFQISVGHIGFVQQFFKQILGTNERVQALTKFLYDKNFVGYREHIKGLNLSSIDKQRLLDFLKLRGGEEVISFGLELIENGVGKDELMELKLLHEILVDFGVNDQVYLDLTLVSHMNYYTGILFEVYADNVGYPIGNGGRYNFLLQKFGKDTGATGFAIRMDRLLESLGEVNIKEQRVCILYSDENRKEAFLLAEKRRWNGEKTILQNINGVKDIDKYTENFSEVIFLIGNQRGGNDS